MHRMLQVVKIMGSRARGNRLELLLPAFVFTSFLEMGLATVKGEQASWLHLTNTDLLKCIVLASCGTNG